MKPISTSQETQLELPVNSKRAHFSILTRSADITITECFRVKRKLPIFWV